MSLIFGLNHEWDIIKLIQAQIRFETSCGGFAHHLNLRNLLSLREVDVWYLTQIRNEGQRLWGHHFLIFWRELKPCISQDVFAWRTFVRIFLEYLLQQSLTCLDMWSGSGNSCLQMFVYSSLSLAPLNGNLPQSKAYKRTPKAHTSAGGPEYSILLTISGAMYEGVPQNILTFFSWGNQVENPKSIILTLVLVSSNNIFSSLISLWVTFLWWR